MSSPITGRAFCTLDAGERIILEAEFWSRVDRSAGPGACWPWKGYSSHQAGYGRLVWRRHLYHAHRLAHEVAHGPIPARLYVLHSCDNPPCCNPDHLSVGTNQDNLRDAAAKGRTARANALLTWDSVAEIRRRAASGETGQSLATAFGISKSAACRVINGTTWNRATGGAA